jgi:ElaA protein
MSPIFAVKSFAMANPVPPLIFHCLPFDRLSRQELYALMALRQEVFVLEQNCPYLDADGLDLTAHHLLGHDRGGRLAAYARLLPPGAAYERYASFGRVVTAPSCRRQGYGKAMMPVLLQWMARLYGDCPAKISAQTYLIDFYQAFGFARQGEEYLEDGIPHVGMVWARRPAH